MGLLGSIPAGRGAVRAAAISSGDLPRAAGKPGVEGRAGRGKALMRVNQWVPAAHKGDAIGDSARRVRGLLRSMGHESDIFALTIDDDLRHDVRPFSDPASKTGDVTIFHFALPSPMSAGICRPAARPRAAVSQRHAGAVSSLPTHLPCSAWPRSLAKSLLVSLAASDLALGDSEYNRQELEELGFLRTGVMPIAVDTDRLTKRAQAAGARGHPRRWAREFPLRRTNRAQQEDRGSHQARRTVQALRRRVLPVYFRRTLRRRAAGTMRPIRALISEYKMLRRPVHLYRAGP